MGENLGRWWCRLTKKDRQNIEFAMDCPAGHVLFQDRERVIERLLEASMLFRGTYATTAAKLQGPPCVPLADPPD
jgi:hypothetical protein